MIALTSSHLQTTHQRRAISARHGRPWDDAGYYPYALLFMAALALSALPAPIALAVSLGLIAVIGVPHGASDYLLVRDDYRARYGPLAIPVFFSAYLSIAALCLLAWLAAPVMALTAFLLLSAWHFAESDRPARAGDMSRAEKFGRGLMPIAGPTILFGDRVTDIFLILTPGAEAAFVATLTSVLQPLGILAIAAMVYATCRRWRNRQYRHAAEVATLLALPLIAPPLASFALYFAFIHSVRQIEKRKAHLNIASTRDYLRRIWPLCLGGIGVMAIAGLNAGTLPDAAISAVFIGLACLTVPHAVLVKHD